MLLDGMGEIDGASEYLTRSAQMSDDNGDRRGAAASRHRLAALLINQGQFDKARQLLCEVEQVLLDAHDPKDYSDWLHSMASLEVGSRQLAAAREYAEKSVAIKRVIPDHETLATALVTLGHIAILEKKSDEAMRHVVEAVEFASRCGAIGSEFSARSLLAQILAKAGDLRAAVQEMETVLTIASGFGASRSEPSIQVFQMIWLNHVQSDLSAFDGQEYDCAMPEIEMKLSQANDAVEKIRWLLVQSVIAARHLNRELSTELIKAARELGKQQRLLEPGYRMVFDEIESQMGEFSEKMPNSLQLLIQGLELLGFHGAGRPRDVKGALNLLTQAEAAARDENNGFALATCLLHKSDAMLHLERSAEAIPMLREALDIATQVEEAGLIKEIHEALSVAVPRTS